MSEWNVIHENFHRERERETERDRDRDRETDSQTEIDRESRAQPSQSQGRNMCRWTFQFFYVNAKAISSYRSAEKTNEITAGRAPQAFVCQLHDRWYIHVFNGTPIQGKVYVMLNSKKRIYGPYIHFARTKWMGHIICVGFSLRQNWNAPHVQTG